MSPSNKYGQEVRILLVGEDGVGKTSLILALVTEEYPAVVPPRIDEVTIPADITPEHVPTVIVDYCRAQGERKLHEELRKASVVCIVYSVHCDTSFEKVTSYWLPEIDKVIGEARIVPVILVGNQSDSPDSHLDKILPLMNQYPQIETCVECSAKTLKNISELFFYAQKAVLHPTAPLYIAEDKDLTQAAKKSLVRIFKICDHDNDGLLNDHELNQFQQLCFNTPLTREALNDVKTVVSRGVNDGIMDNAITLKGFLYLHTLFIQKGRHETTWTSLRKFGYDSNLQLTNDYLYPALKVPKGCTVELSNDGFQFLASLFEKYDEDRDGCLSNGESTNLFSVCATNPFVNETTLNSIETSETGNVTYNGFLCHWVSTTLLDYPRTLEQLAYLGFNANYGSQLSALTVTREKRLDWQARSTNRGCFHAHIIGPRGAGKTLIMQSFLGKNMSKLSKIPKKVMPTTVCNTISVRDIDRYLVLHEVDVLEPEDVLTPFELSCDVAIFVYDASDSDSFDYCASIYRKYFHRTRVPCLFVSNKCDSKSLPLQNYEQQPDEFCGRHRLIQPIRFSTKDIGDKDADIYQKTALLAVYPHLKHAPFMHDASSWLKLGIGAAVVAAFGFALMKNF